MNYPRLDPFIHAVQSALRLGHEYSIPTSHIREHEVVLALLISHVNSVPSANVATVLVRVPPRKEPREDAMLGVENGHVLVNYNFKVRSPLPKEGGKFRYRVGAQIVRRGDTPQPRLQHFVGGDSVGGVQAEVA